MPFTSWGQQSGWLTFLSFLFFLLSLTVLFVVPPFRTGNSHHLASRSQPYSWGETDDLPFRIDSDTWALQHRNYTTPHWIGRRQTVDTNTQQTYTCGPGNPCSNGACCGESGFCGYGSTYCGTGCISNCDATASCGQYSEGGNVTCPLNVCCSQYGFCGTTSDFCGTGCQSNCRTPSSPGSGGDVRNTVIGYWESWRAYQSQSAPCSTMQPSAIPIQDLNGLNYAFAYIKPGTYDIIPMSGYSYDLYAQVTNLKKDNPDAKIFVSVGGWSFNNNNTSTQPVFGDIASSLLKRAQFANKLYQFMVQYGFDGVDLDWEYPGAPDRGGNPQDVGNYPLLLQMIRFKFQVENKPWQISITAPTSYWYLRWFDLKDIINYVDYINLMSYDLHGVWDATDPIGSYVYAHTNLTEIDAALSLFWRNAVPPSKINLGLAFYGRTFQLVDPTCDTPGCPFSTAGAPGECTRTAGILSYAEIQDLITATGSNAFVTYDPVAAVNYMVYDQNNWVSFDDQNTFQQKIDYANANGLNGLFIWAVDMDDPSFSALRAVTGKDIAPTVGQSQTLSYWNINQCFTTPCGTDCVEGFLTMTELNRDDNGNSCPSGQTRSFCCPPWGAPNPATCNWYGSPKYCFGQCAPGEVLLTTDQCGGSNCCTTGTKSFCCPATNGAATVAQCKASYSYSCPSDLPQQLGMIGLEGPLPFCCPAEPTFSNCSWYGDSVTCNNNRCPAGQIELTRSKNGDGGLFSGCIFGRQKALCCDPPFNGTAFLPVQLDYLFPETLPAADAPIYYEAFDNEPENNEVPYFDNSYTEDPNREPFAWTIMVGSEEDVQSLRKRDGSHLETFDCPNPRPEDYSVQTFKAVCTVQGDDNNCEDIALGSVRGTIIRLPEDCGPDEWVRVVSFREIEKHPLPSNLSKRLHENPKVYEIKYDYNLRQLRRDGGEVYVRFDASTHAGYWDEIVSSSPTGPVKRRSAEDWREFHMDWFEHRLEKLEKRGYGTSDSWWLDRFNALLNRNFTYGLQKTYHYQQVLYEAAKSCPPIEAQVSASVMGDLSMTMDYGISLIGTLRNFDFSESYAFFNLYDLGLDSRTILQADAAFSFQSQSLPLLNQWDPFGGSFNLKGLWTVGPYFSATGQIQAQATISGEITAGMIVSTNPKTFTYMFPQSLNQFPSESIIQPELTSFEISPYTSATISADGSVTLSVTPEVGFQIQLHALNANVNTKVVSSFTNAMTVRVAADTGSLINGACYGIDYSMSIDITLENPLPGWQSGPQTISVYGRDMEIAPMQCYPWQTSSKRDLILGSSSSSSSSSSLVTRDGTTPGSLFVDVFGSALGCPNNKMTPTGNCNVTVFDDNGNPMKKRSFPFDEFPDDLHRLVKRSGRKSGTFCIGNSQITALSPTYPNSGELMDAEATNPFSTYGSLNPTDCDDYSYGLRATPPRSKSGQWATEHVLEWQLYIDFWQDIADASTQTFLTANAKDRPGTMLSMCKYMQFWWNTRTMALHGSNGKPVDLVATAFPSDTQFRNEFILIDLQTNGAKEALWGDKQIRDPTTMMNYLNGRADYDFNSAINVCKYIIFAMDYVNIPAVTQILVNQATRIGQYFDDMELVLAGYNDPTWNTAPYQVQHLGNLWRDFMYQQWSLQISKQQEFLNRWVPEIESWFQADENGDVQMGGFEDNQDVLGRVSALTEAWQNLPGNLPNPFPANWQLP